MRLQDEVAFKKDGKPSKRLFFTASLRRRNYLRGLDRKEANRKLREENIRTAEERGRPELKDNQEQGVTLALTTSQIRKKLRRRENAKKQNR